MKSLHVLFLRRLLVFSAIVGILFLAIHLLFPMIPWSPAMPFTLFFFMATTLLSYLFILKSTEKRMIRFVNTYLLTIIIKLIVYIAVMVGYVFINRADAVPFMISFFILYLSFTVFETVMIVNATRKPQDGSSQG